MLPKWGVLVWQDIDGWWHYTLIKDGKFQQDARDFKESKDAWTAAYRDEKLLRKHL